MDGEVDGKAAQAQVAGERQTQIDQAAPAEVTTGSRILFITPTLKTHISLQTPPCSQR